MDILSLYNQTSGSTTGDPNAEREAVMNEVIDQVNAEFPAKKLSAPTQAERAEIQERVTILVSAGYRRRNQRPGAQYEEALAQELTRRLLGFGFLDLLLPPARTDISEIAVYSSGLVQVMRKGAVRFEAVDLRPEPGEIWRVLDRIIGPQNRSLNEANPVVYAKLPPSPDNPGGGRITALHPAIAPPGKNPAINLRLFEQKPVLPEWLIERGAASAEMMADLGQAMQAGTRI
ncbi:MAG: hypothetical protein CVU39_28815, partial [Chloroflexi bacterium HGW-Chloroflexi-10]